MDAEVRVIDTVEGHGLGSVARLGIRNAARHPGRSMLTAGLLASAAFLIVAVEAFRRHVDAPRRSPGNGGFDLVAESDLPLFRDLNGAEGRQEVEDKLLPIYREKPAATTPLPKSAAKECGRPARTEEKVVAFRVQAGDDASCLNLYQPLRPRVLGVPVGFAWNQHEVSSEVR